METKLILWDRENNKPGDALPLPKKEDVKIVRQRFWKNSNGDNVEGCVIEMREGHEPSEYGLANVASEARRALAVITPTPKGSEAVRTN